jgi:hypothetical protein
MSYNHYVPAWLLRNFVAPDGKLSVFDLSTKAVSRDPAGQVGGDHGVYEFVVPQTHPKTVEDYLQVVESDASRPVRKLLTAENTVSLSSEDRMKIAKFISIQSFRTKAFFVGLEVKYQNREALFNELLRSSKLAEQEIVSRVWYLMEIRCDREFYIGDHPVALQHSEDQNYRGMLGWDVKSTDAYLPLTPKRCLWLPPLGISSEIAAGYEKASKLLGEIRMMPPAAQSHPYGSGEKLALLERIERNSGPIYDSIKNGCPLVADKENIDNINALQILFGESVIFSKSGDFEFAKTVLEKTPEYGNVARTSVAFVWPHEVREE